MNPETLNSRDVAPPPPDVTIQVITSANTANKDSSTTLRRQ